MERNTRALGLAVVGFLAAVLPAAAVPVASDPTMIVLPTTEPVDVQLVPQSLRLVTGVDFTSALTLFEAVDPPVNLSDLQGALNNPVHFNVGFSFTWNGTVNGGVDADDFFGPGGPPPHVLFTIIDERWRNPNFDENNPLGTSVSVIGGYVRDSFEGDDIIDSAPLIVQDIAGGGLISDVVGDRWIGVKLPLVEGTPVGFEFEFALGSDVTGLAGFDNNLNIRIFREAFLVPAPSALLLLATALPVLALMRRRRSA
jgi:hypothetical protein